MAEEKKPYTSEQVLMVEDCAGFIANLLHDPWADEDLAWRALDPVALTQLFHDAMVALSVNMWYEETEEDD